MTDIEKRIIEYGLTFPGAYLDYPFHDDTAALRLTQNKKNFVFILHKNGEIWMNLKLEPLKGDFFRMLYKSVRPGFHMNDKAVWNTVVMDGGVPWEVIEEMIGDSYDIVKPRPRKRREEAGDDF